MTLPGPILPREVFDEIISQSDEASTLKSCSLVCRSFRRSAQKILFHSINVDLLNIGYHGAPSDPINLVSIVIHAVHLIQYVQKLRISVHRPLNVDGDITDLANALDIFSLERESFPINLRSLWLESLAWHWISPRFQNALVLLTTVHSLRDITLYHATDCSPDLIQNLPPPFKQLSLKDTTFLSLPTNRNGRPKLDSLTIRIRTGTFCGGLYGSLSDAAALERIVNMSQLKTFQGGICNPSTMPVIERILQSTSNSLEHLTFEQFS
ncbi:hypothetical protein M378DRAFT_18827 [Amanita muscaria Koide BX008]|uniref:Uncharacterized protein n=1 Tax=Amanita muscaria (strain Koide BX008) TaxID=946122 RepID=A0A0C2WD84_AMAMK|nr:hypothetical protein M378DRAFT_18827 [Amanita muscaria Koide BX008]